MATMPAGKRPVSWGVIIFLLIVFYPVGIALLIKKVNSEKFAYAQNARTMSILGWILLCVGIIYLLSALTGETQYGDGGAAGTAVISVLIWVGTGAALVICARSYKVRAEKYARYVLIINSRDEYSLDNISAAFPAPYEQTCADLQKMLNDGYFLNAYLDLRRRELVMPKPAKAAAPAYVFTQAARSGPRVAKCPGCGAFNTLPNGEIGECEYCGLPLQ